MAHTLWESWKLQNNLLRDVVNSLLLMGVECGRRGKWRLQGDINFGEVYQMTLTRETLAEIHTRSRLEQKFIGKVLSRAIISVALYKHRRSLQEGREAAREENVSVTRTLEGSDVNLFSLPYAQNGSSRIFI